MLKTFWSNIASTVGGNNFGDFCLCLHLAFQKLSKSPSQCQEGSQTTVEDFLKTLEEQGMALNGSCSCKII